MANPNSIAAAMLQGGKNSGKGSATALSPLVQSYLNQATGQNVNFLPRTNETFTQGAFTPGGPIEPMAINEPGQSGRPDPRRTQFPVNWNLPVGQPGSEGLKLANFATLRAVADEYSVARACINKRIHEIVALKWDIIPTDQSELDMRGKKNKRNEWEKRREEVINFFESPDSDKSKYPTFASWLTALLEDVAVIDAVAIRMRPPRKTKSGPLNSDLASLDLIDGTTIRPMLDVYGSTPRPPDVAFQQYLWGVPRVDMTAIITDDDIKQMEDPVAKYRSDQLMYLRFNPRNWTPYGFSWVEQTIMPISIGLARQQWQWNYYQDGSIPGQWVTAGPDIATPQQIRQFQDALNSLAGDPAQKHKIVVLPPGSNSRDMKPITLADQFDEWIVSTVTMGFGLTPEDIGISPKVALSQGSAAAKQEAAAQTDAGAQNRIEPITDWLKDCLFDFIIQEIMGQEDMQWSWGLTDRGESRDDVINQHVTLLEHGYESIDEGRIELGNAPWGLPETSVPLAWTTAGPVPISTLTSQSGDMVNPAPGQADSLGRKPTDEELVTPAHGQDAPPEGGPVNPPQGARSTSDGDTRGRNPASVAAHNGGMGARQPSAAAKAEFSQLARFIKNGKDPREFLAKALTEEIVSAAIWAHDEGPDASIDAARAVLDDPKVGKDFNPLEPRDWHGRWGEGGGEDKPKHVPKAKLKDLSTKDLIEQYHLAISSHAGRYTDTQPRQKRIDHIVDLISERADKNDPDALAWYDDPKVGKGFNPSESRDWHGRWGDGVGLSGQKAKRLVELTKKNGGASVHIKTGKSPRSGFMVAHKEGSVVVNAKDFYGPHGHEMIQEYVKHHPELQDSHEHLGTWHDKQSGKVFLDVSRREEDQKKAVSLGKKNNQIAIYDIGKGEEVPTGGTGGL